MINSNYYEDNQDLQNHVNHFIDWDEVVALYEGEFSDAAEYKKTGDARYEWAPNNTGEAVEFYKQIMTTMGDFMGTKVSQIAQEMDARGGPEFKDGQVTYPYEFADLINQYHETGLTSLAFKRRYGGLGLPHVVKALCSEICYRADTSFTIAAGSLGLAGILELYADEEMRNEWIPKLMKENYSVTMGLSEADFGSDLPNIRTKAENIDGQWFVSGTKRFQTMACGVNGNPSLVLMLARSGPAGGGARGLSFFLVEGKHIEIVGLEKKLGLKASATCEIAFEKAPAQLIGKEGHGLSTYVIGMLNGARMGVAAQGTGMSTTAFFEARQYAGQRIQFGEPIAQIPAVAKILRKMERENAAMRCLMVEAALSVDRYHWQALRLKEEGLGDREVKRHPQIKQWEKLADALTPMSKYYNAESANAVCYDAIQVFGGSGFIEEYDVARLYRDVRISNIYDGTTQIQVNAAIGPIISGMTENGRVREYLDSLSASIEQTDSLKTLRDQLEELYSLFKSLPSAVRADLSFEMVQSMTRYLCGQYLQKTVLKLDGEARDERAQMVEEYNLDSLGIFSNNLVHMRAAAQKPTAASSAAG